MSGPQELHISFRHLDTDYDINLQKGGKSAHSVEINGISYAVLGEKEKLDTACEILNSISLDSISTAEDLHGRLSVLKNISFPTQKTDDIGIKTLKPTSLAPVLELPSRNIAKLIRMVKNIPSDADIQALCRECLAQNNNNVNLALASLRTAFYQAGAGKVSGKITDMLAYEASDRNVDEIRAFGRKRTVDVIQFLKTLPQTVNGAIDLTKMKKIGQGGTQDVFVLKYGPFPFVIKVNRASLGMKKNERLEKYKTDNAAYKALHGSFGDHCTVEQLLLRDVSDASGTKKAIISVADFEVGFQKDSKLGLQDSDFNWNEVTVVKHLDAYEGMLKSVFFSENAPSFDLSTLEAMNPKVAKIANLIREEPDFGHALKEFLTKFKEYFNKTGQYLDIAGRDNIIFFKDDERWTFKLGTVIKVETAKKFEDSLNWLHNGSKKTEESENHMGMLTYCFNWTKALNTLAMMVGMEKVIVDPNVVTMWSDLEKAEITGKPSNPQRFLNILQAVETDPANKLLERFEAIGVNPEKEADSLLAILSESPSPNKKLVLANYLHQVLPKVPNGVIADDPDAFKFCSVRFHIALAIEKIPGGKALALECYEEVMKDPRGPHQEVRKAMSELS